LDRDDGVGAMRCFETEFLQLKEQHKRERGAAWDRCPHKSTETRRKVFKNGSLHFASQCLTCGDRIGAWISKSKFNGGTARDWDENLVERFYARRKEMYDAGESSHGEQWWNLYNEYLLSQQWEVKRRLVMLRANNLCEGCRTTMATQVHHCSYAHVGNEFLFELVAICSKCHDRIHGVSEQFEDF
jgi:hypothetical protein